ncbi:MAG: hypothetical protein AB7Q97_14960 [Gammaproteobacteria bacterium]
MGRDRNRLEKRHYDALADFRYQLRRFLRLSEQAVRLKSWQATGNSSHA